MSKLNDLDLMLLADGESDAAPAGAHARTTTAADLQKIEGIREVGELVRGHLELSADEAEPRLAGLWDLVERRLDADERAEQVPAAREPVKAAQPGLWSRVGAWFAGHRSQVFTGVVAAGAAAAVTLLVRPAPEPETKIVTREIIKEVPPALTPPGPGPTQQFAAMPAEVESLEVNGGSGAVFTIEDEEGDTTVIWVTPDDVLEGL